MKFKSVLKESSYIMNEAITLDNWANMVKNGDKRALDSDTVRAVSKEGTKGNEIINDTNIIKGVLFKKGVTLTNEIETFISGVLAQATLSGHIQSKAAKDEKKKEKEKRVTDYTNQQNRQTSDKAYSNRSSRRYEKEGPRTHAVKP